MDPSEYDSHGGFLQPSLLSFLPPRSNLAFASAAALNPLTISSFLPPPSIDQSSYFRGGPSLSSAPSFAPMQPFAPSQGAQPPPSYDRSSFLPQPYPQYQQQNPYQQQQRFNPQQQSDLQSRFAPSNQFSHQPNGDSVSFPTRLHPPGGHSQMGGIFGNPNPQQSQQQQQQQQNYNQKYSAQNGQSYFPAIQGRQQSYSAPLPSYPQSDQQGFRMRPNGAANIISEAKRVAFEPFNPNPGRHMPSQQQSQDAPINDGQFHTRRLAPPGGQSSVSFG
eukprot:TRINITY_DN7342_c0_g3_i2.p1 TRINITY_DN7342_c0_g3~~TRINITY_DN7342_c0_g3_i2.p1  ORF type:complete len:276 (-),score=62.70 TRINITY_DN7342_c0_g3_i2:384-1211(-)